MSIIYVGMPFTKDAQVEIYRERHGHYPERVLADPLYGTRANRDYLKQRSIRFAGKPLGRPKQITDENREQLKQAKEQRRQAYLQRIPIEGKFGQGKTVTDSTISAPNGRIHPLPGSTASSWS